MNLIMITKVILCSLYCFSVQFIFFQHYGNILIRQLCMAMFKTLYVWFSKAP